MNLHVQKLHKHFVGTDADVDGCVSFGKFKAAVDDPSICLWLHAMELEVGQVEAIFKLIVTSGDGAVTIEELIGHGSVEMPGP